jgi:DNA polymerase III subunit epsilon
VSGLSLLPGLLCGGAVLPLSQLEVLVIDCQATAASPRGHLLELGWARVRPTATQPHARLIRLPDHERIPPAVARITGISESMSRAGVDARTAWRELSDDASRIPQQPAPAVVHFARFERPFLRSLAGGVPALDLVCTHDIARRLLPDLPRRSLRALSGYFGRGVGALRRCADHVEATAFVWRELVRLLDEGGVNTWSALHEWLAAPVDSTKHARRVWPMPRAARLSLPDAPGLYRMLRSSGDVLYVGKASSLHHRVNSYFRKQHGVHERMLEMLSQARGVSFEVTPSALEAALLEPDEIKRHRPPYNVALTVEHRQVWFTARDLSERSPRASARCPVGPFSGHDTLDQFAALAHASGAALGRGRWAPDAAIFDAGYARLCATHPELSRDDFGAHARLLRLGTRLWREGRRDGDGDPVEAPAKHRSPPAWTPELVQLALEWLALRAALARRRARWLTRLVDAAVVWSEPGPHGARMIVVENGEIAVRASVEPGAMPPVPPGHSRPVAARHEAFTIARYDRLRVLTTELKRLVSEGAPVTVRFGVAPVLTGEPLAHALSWV